jgi:putative transposase
MPGSRVRIYTYNNGGQLISDIRDALNTGLVLGNDRFREEVEQLTGQRQQHLKRGPKPA